MVMKTIHTSNWEHCSVPSCNWSASRSTPHYQQSTPGVLDAHHCTDVHPGATRTLLRCTLCSRRSRSMRRGTWSYSGQTLEILTGRSRHDLHDNSFGSSHCWRGWRWWWRRSRWWSRSQVWSPSSWRGWGNTLCQSLMAAPRLFHQFIHNRALHNGACHFPFFHIIPQFCNHF